MEMSKVRTAHTHRRYFHIRSAIQYISTPKMLRIQSDIDQWPLHLHSNRTKRKPVPYFEWFLAVRSDLQVTEWKLNIRRICFTSSFSYKFRKANRQHHKNNEPQTKYFCWSLNNKIIIIMMPSTTASDRENESRRRKAAKQNENTTLYVSCACLRREFIAFSRIVKKREENWMQTEARPEFNTVH